MELHKCPLTKDEKLRMISDAAYYHSEISDPLDTDPMNDWMNAVAEFEKAFNRQCARQNAHSNKGLLARVKTIFLNSLEKAGKVYPKIDGRDYPLIF